MSWWGWLIGITLGIAGFLTGWTAAVICKAILSEPHDVWEDEEW